MKTYRAALIGCSRMGAFIDHERNDPGPHSHAAAYVACKRTDLVACSDLRPEPMAEAGRLYGVPFARQYTDYREMMVKEQPDIVSIATQPEQRAAIVIFAAQNGVKGIYAEKAMSASLEEADSMVKEVEDRQVAFNLGTHRRWHPGFDAMKEVIHSGHLGPLKSLILHSTGSLFNSASHGFDLLFHLSDDCPVDAVQAQLNIDVNALEGDVLHEDPSGHGFLYFANGVTGYALNSGRGMEVEAVCRNGHLSSLNNGWEWELRETTGIDPRRGRPCLKRSHFPAFQPIPPVANIVMDLVHALDSGQSTRGGVRTALAGHEVIFGFIESHRRGGIRVNLPIQNRTLKLRRERVPNQPRYRRT